MLVYHRNEIYAVFDRAEIDALRQEREEIGKVLRLAKSDRNHDEEDRDIDRLLTLIDRLDETKRQCKNEERDIKELDVEVQLTCGLQNSYRHVLASNVCVYMYRNVCVKRIYVTIWVKHWFLSKQIENIQDLINQERKVTGSVTEESSELMVSKRLRVTENRLDQVIYHLFNPNT